MVMWHTLYLVIIAMSTKDGKFTNFCYIKLVSSVKVVALSQTETSYVWDSAKTFSFDATFK